MRPRVPRRRLAGKVNCPFSLRNVVGENTSNGIRRYEAATRRQRMLWFQETVDGNTISLQISDRKKLLIKVANSWQSSIHNAVLFLHCTCM